MRYNVANSSSTNLNISSLKSKQETPNVRERADSVKSEPILKLVEVRLICGVTRPAKPIPKYSSPVVTTTGTLIFKANTQAEESVATNTGTRR